MSFRAFPPWLNVAILIVGGVFVWGAGSKLAKYTDAIAIKTGLSREFLGALMLGGMTSLPELAVTVSATLVGNAHLAVNNLLGGITMQVAILAVADVAVGAAAISTLVKDPVVRLQGTLLIVLLSITVAGILVGEPDGWRIGPWSMAILAGGVVAFFLIYRSESHDPKESGELAEKERSLSLRGLVLRTISAGAVILGAGYAVAVSGDALGEQSGLGASFVGFVLVAIVTSLPELSTTIGAARIGRADMAFSNIFGTNVIDLAFVGLVDILWSRGPVLDEVGEVLCLGGRARGCGDRRVCRGARRAA